MGGLTYGVTTMEMAAAYGAFANNGVIGGVPREVPVAVVGGGTGLTGDGHAAEGRGTAGAAGDH